MHGRVEAEQHGDSCLWGPHHLCSYSGLTYLEPTFACVWVGCMEMQMHVFITQCKVCLMGIKHKYCLYASRRTVSDMYLLTDIQHIQFIFKM